MARRLEKLLRDTPVELLHDRRIPGKVSNIDHIAVGPTGVTVIDAKRWKGDVRVRGGQLMVKGRDQSRLVEGVRKQMLVIDGVLTDLPPVPIHGFICWVNGEGLPTFGKLELQGVRIDGAKRIAKELKRDGPTTLERVLVLRDLLARRLPAAA